MLDAQYSIRAKEVGTRQITKAHELRKAMDAYVPSDTEFEEAFAVARVSRPHLARYYLRAMEKTKKALPDPEYVPNEDVSDVNLEHILPVKPSSDWDIKPDAAQAAHRLLGNRFLLKTRKNTDLGNSRFEVKKAEYKKSGYDLTRDVAKHATWTIEAFETGSARWLSWPLRRGR